MIHQCIVLAGGLGTRVRHIQPNRPKALISVGGQPFIHWQLTWLAQQNVHEVILAVGHHAGEIRTYVRTGSAWGLSIYYVEDTAGLLGTGGAVRKVADSPFVDTTVAVLYGDTLLRVTVQALAEDFSGKRYAGIMTVLHNKNRWDDSNVAVEGPLVTKYAKGTTDRSGLEHIDYGLSLFRRSAIVEGLSLGRKADLAALYEKMIVRKMLGACEVNERFYEIGSPQGVAELDRLLRSGWRP